MDTRDIVAAYCSAWNEPDEAKRTALLDAAWSDDGVYHDPTATAEGRAALVAHIAGFQATFPGHTIDPASGVDDNGDGLRFAWVMRKGDEVVLEGMDFAELAPDGRIQRIAGFFGPFPPLDE
jgi:SnoaL-like domain